MKHIFFEDGDQGMPSQIQDRNGQVCLSLCKICEGIEASLPTECPKRFLNSNEHDLIQQNKIDFIDGEWKNLENKTTIQ